MQKFKHRKNFLADRKAYSGIIATIFMVLIALFLFFNVFMFVLDRNTAFQDSASQANQLFANRIAEKFRVSTPTYAINDAHQVSVSVNVVNVSPESVLIESMWIKDSAAANPNCLYAPESTALQPGQSAILTAAVIISNASSLDIGSCTSWFVTARGRTISTIASESTIGVGSGNGACAADLFGISGADWNSTSPSGPFETLSGVPLTGGNTQLTNAGNPSINTNNAHDFIIGALGVQNQPQGVQVHPDAHGHSYTPICSPQVDASHSRFTYSAYYIASATSTFNPDFAWQLPGNWGVILDASKQSPSGTLAIDSSFSSFVTSGNTLTLTFTTHSKNEVLYLSWVGNVGQTITTVSTAGSSSSSSWTQRAQVSADNGGNRLLETWYAIGYSAGLYTVIVTMSNSGS